MPKESVDTHCVEVWFGAEFARLHPLLQRLHTRGGQLDGDVDICVGTGLAGAFGRRLAGKMGIPLGDMRCRMQVTISHDAQHLFWARRFTNGDGAVREMTSVFVPVNHYPDGYWLERTGALQFKMTVDVIEGGWHWRVLGATLHGVPLPVGFMPRSRAYKRIENGGYRFEVAFEMPWLGTLLSYSGWLQLTT
jgi:hypothetical protein